MNNVQDSLRQKIIEATQQGMPISAQPYAQLAKQLLVSEKDIVETLRAMKKDGLIRRIGIVPNHYAIGYMFNLMTVWDIKDNDIDQVGHLVGSLEFVSHCYQRPRHLPDWPYNFFAMVHGMTEQETDDKIEQIRRLVASSCKQDAALKSSRILKKTGLRI